MFIKLQTSRQAYLHPTESKSIHRQRVPFVSPIPSVDASYGPAGNRTKMLREAGLGVNYSDDAGNQLTREFNSFLGLDTTYACVPSGNRTLTIDNGGRTTSTFDAADRTISSIGLFDTLEHQWDANGNQIGVSSAKTPLATFTWDYEDRLKSAEIDGLNLRITALYDADHRRIARTQTFDSNTDSSRFIWDRENVLQVTDNSNVTKVDYTLEPSFYGKLISQRQGTDSVYHHFDALGSTQQLTDAMGVPIDSYDYTAYGAGGPALETVPNLYQFVGDLGYSADNPFILYIRRRWYFTFFGRWASRDKVLYALDEPVLQYSYADNNPSSSVDPSGEFGISAIVPRNCTQDDHDGCDKRCKRVGWKGGGSARVCYNQIRDIDLRTLIGIWFRHTVGIAICKCRGDCSDKYPRLPLCSEIETDLRLKNVNVCRVCAPQDSRNRSIYGPRNVVKATSILSECSSEAAIHATCCMQLSTKTSVTYGILGCKCCVEYGASTRVEQRWRCKK